MFPRHYKMSFKTKDILLYLVFMPKWNLLSIINKNFFLRYEFINIDNSLTARIVILRLPTNLTFYIKKDILIIFFN